MADKLKCPFCGGELYSSDNCYVCLNDDCIFCGFHFMEKRWKPIIELKQAQIQAKQDLEIARKALKDIASGQIIEHSVCGHECDNKIAIARNALKYIEHKD